MNRCSFEERKKHNNFNSKCVKREKFMYLFYRMFATSLGLSLICHLHSGIMLLLSCFSYVPIHNRAKLRKMLLKSEQCFSKTRQVFFQMIHCKILKRLSNIKNTYKRIKPQSIFQILPKSTTVSITPSSPIALL